jgi:hypothetical protein
MTFIPIIVVEMTSVPMIPNFVEYCFLHSSNSCHRVQALGVKALCFNARHVSGGFDLPQLTGVELKRMCPLCHRKRIRVQDCAVPQQLVITNLNSGTRPLRNRLNFANHLMVFEGYNPQWVSALHHYKSCGRKRHDLYRDNTHWS